MVLILPTLFFVMILAFLLSKLVPGDMASSMLQLQGVQTESIHAKKEYLRQYERLGLDKPVFYFSLLPHFYPYNINTIADLTTRNQTRSFLKQKRNHLWIDQYLKARDSFIETSKKDLTYKDEFLIQNISKLAFETRIDELDKTITQIALPANAGNSTTFSSMKRSFENLKAHHENHYMPTFRWYGLNNQFHSWVVQILKGNFGISMKDGRPVSQKILSAINWTLLLVMLNLLFSSIIALPFGLFAGYNENSYFDLISNFIWLLLYSIPIFWLASLMITYFTSTKFSQGLDIFPPPGTWYIPDGQALWKTIIQYSHQLILPVICLVANDIAHLSRIIRNNVINQKSNLYVRFARAKGLTPGQILLKHILPNVMIPLVTIIGARIPAGLSGALIIEVIFNIPGMGRLMFDSIYSNDWNVVFGILIIISFLTILFNLLTDIIYTRVNPKTAITFAS
jgi:peptide/nickel transport system permease protein